MQIKPLIGLGSLEFGMTRSEVFTLMNRPEIIDNQNAKLDEFSDESWHYLSRGIHLKFDSSYEFRLRHIKLTTIDSGNHEVSIIGSPEARILAEFTNVKLNGSYKNIKEYTDRKNRLEFYLRSNFVTEVQLEPDPKIEFYNHCSKNFQRHFTCRRLLKNNVRRNEREVAKLLPTLDHHINLKVGDNLLPSAIEWFLGNYLSINPETRALWCDGVRITSLTLIGKRTFNLNANADILSSIDDSAYDVCELTGNITIASNGKKLRAYNLKLNYRNNFVVIKK